MDVLTQLLENSGTLLLMAQVTSHRITDLQLQVETLVEALGAEDPDPDGPVTTYMSGKPV
jgi:hypothetical protein